MLIWVKLASYTLILYDGFSMAPSKPEHEKSFVLFPNTSITHFHDVIIGACRKELTRFAATLEAYRCIIIARGFVQDGTISIKYTHPILRIVQNTLEDQKIIDSVPIG